MANLTHPFTDHHIVCEMFPRCSSGLACTWSASTVVLLIQEESYPLLLQLTCIQLTCMCKMGFWSLWLLCFYIIPSKAGLYICSILPVFLLYGYRIHLETYFLHMIILISMIKLKVINVLFLVMVKYWKESNYPVTQFWWNKICTFRERTIENQGKLRSLLYNNKYSLKIKRVNQIKCA